MRSKHVSTPELIRPSIGLHDRLGATLVLSAVVHGVILLGVGFALEDPAKVQPTLDVLLTQTHTEEVPDKADFLAQDNQRGGGDAEHPERPREPQIGQIAQPDPGLAAVPLNAQMPMPQPRPTPALLGSDAGTPDHPPPEETPPQLESVLPLGPSFVERDARMARLAAEVERQRVAYAHRAHEKRISASTREYVWAGYMRAWVDRVERIGNLNYPQEARRRKLSGKLVLTVAIAHDGSVRDVQIVDSSGSVLLDDAAVRIVRLAQPFPPLPETPEPIDLLHITRTWQFEPIGTFHEYRGD